MRPASILEIVGSNIDDAAILSGLQTSVPISKKLVAQLGTAYKEYARKKGSASILNLGLLAPWPDRLSALYAGRALKHGLGWIEDIASTTRYGYCPMCGSETHKTVEHFLPRKPWAEFSIFSLNLVPSCGTCNTKRGNRASSPSAKTKIFHPYFDVKQLARPLHTTRILRPYEIPLFEPKPHPNLSKVIATRVQYHIDQSIDETE